MPTFDDARSLEPITAANLEGGDIDFVFEASSNRVRPVLYSERRKTVAQVAESAPVNAAVATLTVSPAGANNTITYDAVTAGAAANDITIAYTTPVAATLTVSVANQAVTVAAGTKHVMTLTGVTNPVSASVLTYAGEVDGYQTWSSGPTFDTEGVYLTLSPTGVGSINVYSGGNTVGNWTSSDTGEWPDGLTYVADDAETGTPSVAASIPTAAMVVTAVGDSPDAFALVDPTPVDDVTGAVAAYAADNLAGGVDPTAATSPLIFTTTMGYVNVGTVAAPVWNEWPIYGLGETPT